MAEIPRPNYEYDIEQLIKAYEKALTSIANKLNRIDLDDFQRAQTNATLKSIGEILSDLNETSKVWVEANITKAVTDGILATIVSLGVADSIEEAEKIVKFNKVNKELVKSAIADTQSDLLAVTQNVDRKVRSTVRSVSAEVLRNNLPKGINGTATLKREMMNNLKAKLGKSLDTGIIDAAGRRWKPQTYVEMLVRTKMMEAHKESTRNEALSRKVLYGVISKHGATDACKDWEGKVVKFTPEAEGDYPYIEDLPRNKIFHPNCKHVVTAIRKPETA